MVNPIYGGVTTVNNPLIGVPSEQGGEIFNDYKNNKALDLYAASFGRENIAGCYGFSIIAVDFLGDLDSTSGTTRSTQAVLTLSTDKFSNIEVNDICSFKIDNNYDFAKVTGLDPVEKKVTLEVPNGFLTWDTKVTENSVMWLLNEPFAGEIPCGDAAFVAGAWNKALADGSFVANATNIGLGKWSATFGQHNETGYNGFTAGSTNRNHGMNGAIFGENNYGLGKSYFITGKHNSGKGLYYAIFGEGNTNKGVRGFISGGSNTITENAPDSFVVGNSNKADGNYTFVKNYLNKATARCASAQGDRCNANGDSSDAGGVISDANGRASLTRGIGLIADGYAQAVFGQYNAPLGSNTEKDAVAYLVVGNGTSKTNRSNAFVAYTDGHIEVQKTGDSDNSVVTKSYVDKSVGLTKKTFYDEANGVGAKTNRLDDTDLLVGYDLTVSAEILNYTMFRIVMNLDGDIDTIALSATRDVSDESLVCIGYINPYNSSIESLRIPFEDNGDGTIKLKPTTMVGTVDVSYAYYPLAIEGIC